MSLLPTLEAAVTDAAQRWELRDDAAGVEATNAAGDASATVAVPSPVRRARRRRWPLVVGGAGALAAAGIAGVLVVGIGSGDGPLDLAAEASAAIAPSAGEILYFDMTVQSHAYIDGKRMNESKEAGLPRHVEQWSTDRPRRYRMKTHASVETKKFYGQPRKPVIPLTEDAWGDRAQSSYTAEYRSMRVTTHLSPRSSASRLPAFPGARQSLGDLRALLDRGLLTDRGTGSVDGRPVRRLIGKTARDAWPGTVEYDLDPTTFAPVRIFITQKPMQPRQRGKGLRAAMSRMTFTISLKVNRFERIPFNDETAELLTIRPPAGTKIVTKTLGQARAEGRAKRRAEQRAAAQNTPPRRSP